MLVNKIKIVAFSFVLVSFVFADMETKYFNMDVSHVKKLINKKTLTIVCVHCYGIASEIIKISDIAKKKKIFLIEDICLNFGGKLNEKFYGSFGDASISEKHCNFFVNKGNARFEDMKDLIEFVAECVFKKTGIKLETEIKILE